MQDCTNCEALKRTAEPGELVAVNCGNHQFPAPELAVQDFLRRHTARIHPERDNPVFALQLLEQNFAIKARRHGTFPNLVLLKYNQIESPFGEEAVKDCRGLILDEADDWAVVCMTYRKFFNHGETNAAEIDWSHARVYEKLDGSLIQLYFYAGEWRVATSGTPDAECQVGDFKQSFRELFWQAARNYGIHTGSLDPECCYAFELCSPYNRVVVQHDHPTLWLHGVRHLPTLTEEAPEPHARRMNVPVAPSYPLADIEAVVRAARDLDPLAQEGYVVRDADFNRVKVKSPAYVALHHAKDGLLSRRMMCNVIRKGEAEELRTALSAFPELADEFRLLQHRYDDLCYDAEIVFGHILLEQATGRIGPSRKDFAAYATKDPRLAGVLFHLLDRELTRGIRPTESIVKDYFANLHEKAYMRLLDVKDEPAKEIAA